MTKIMGVDFSGARGEKKSATWLAQGRLEGGILTLETCHPIIRADLTANLQALNEPATVAMDFPFSVPVEFANYWQRSKVLDDGWEMPNLWAAAAHLTSRWDKFKDLQAALRLEKFKREPNRIGDPPESFSPLHTTRPNMVPMTFKGMRLLHDIWASQTANSLLVPPLAMPRQGAGTHTTTLLEVMPGATLLSLNLLPAYNGYKDSKDARENRQGILTALPNQVAQLGLNLAGLPYALTQTCRANDDALDAVVAAITAALWAEFPAGFRHPPQPGHPDYQTTLLEGWLYAPRILGGNQ